MCAIRMRIWWRLRRMKGNWLGWGRMRPGGCDWVEQSAACTCGAAMCASSQMFCYNIRMGLFKSKDERRIDREMKIRTGLRAVERSIRQQEKFSEDFIRNAQHAKKIGDNNQYLFIRSALKK